MPVHVFHSSMAGAPVLSGTAGSLLAVLDATLVNGFGLKSVDSLSVIGEVATLNISTGHAFEPGSIVQVSGATPAALNGVKIITSATGSSANFAAPGVANGNATGTVTARLAPLGWSKAFAGTNKAVYRPTDVTATGCYLRVDDSSTGSARVVGYESMSDVDSGNGRFPTDEQQSGGAHWNKSYNASSEARPWMIVGDGRAFYFCVASYPFNSPPQYTIQGFGDLLAYRSPDPYGCFISGHLNNSSSTSGVPEGDMGYSRNYGNTEGGLWLARSAHGLGGSTPSNRISMLNGAYSGSTSQFGTFPNNADNGLIVQPLVSFSAGGFRGEFPGITHAMQFIGSGFATRDFVMGTGQYAGRKMTAVTVGVPTGGNRGIAFFDTTGPWR